MKLTKDQKMLIFVAIAAFVVVYLQLRFVGVAIDFDKVLDPREFEARTIVAKLAVYTVLGTLGYAWYKGRR